jgi:hypothetical protein
MNDRSRLNQRWVNEELYKVLDVFGFRAVMFLNGDFVQRTCAVQPNG